MAQEVERATPVALLLDPRQTEIAPPCGRAALDSNNVVCVLTSTAFGHDSSLDMYY